MAQLACIALTAGASKVGPRIAHAVGRTGTIRVVMQGSSSLRPAFGFMT